MRDIRIVKVLCRSLIFNLCVDSFGPRLWYNSDFDASGLWKDIEINTVGADVIWGLCF